jgi:hypothetical protein
MAVALQMAGLPVVSSPCFLPPEVMVLGYDRQTDSRLENEAHMQVLGVCSVPGGIQRPRDYRHGSRGHGHASASIRPDTHLVANGRSDPCTEIGSWAQAQELLKLVTHTLTAMVLEMPVSR